MSIYSYWFLLALTLLAMEMATGTFYLLLLSIATAVAGVAALFSAGITTQLMLCALTAAVGILVLRNWKRNKAKDVTEASLDIGQPVQLLTWHENGSARVLYRGAEWDAEPESSTMPREGMYYIKEVRGSSLILTHHKPKHH